MVEVASSSSSGGASKGGSGAGGSRHRRRRRSPYYQEQSFTSYLAFGASATFCLGVFLVSYLLVLTGLSPLLREEATKTAAMAVSSSDHHELKRGEVLKPVVDPLVEKMKHMPHVPGQRIAEGVSSAVRKQLSQFRKRRDLTDANLMEKAAAEIDSIRKRREEKRAAAKAAGGYVGFALGDPAKAAPGSRTGVVVLGMHRSGTSMVSGLLVKGAGYQTGGPLIGGAFDNEKGFFERIDVVLQNDEFMKHQRIWWSNNVISYDHVKALEDKKSGTAEFTNGYSALAFLNDVKNAPWLQKDPRMCITLKTWLELLDHEPAVLFTYRHPLEVALSLKKREQNFSLEHGLRLWVIYNMRAIQNSAGLCRVLSSNEAILANPLHEIQRIADDLTNKCGVPEPPRRLTQDDVDRFIDPNLQHNKKKRELEDAAKPVIEDYGDGCLVRGYDSDYREGSPDHNREKALYLIAMKIFCDFKSGKAYGTNYVWPKLP